MKIFFSLLAFVSSILTLNAQVVSTVSGNPNTGVFQEGYGSGVQAKFYSPFGCCVDANENVFVADTYNHRIRKIAVDGTVTTIAGSTEGDQDGTGIGAKFNEPQAICVDAIGNLYVADTYNHKIRKITPTGVVTTFAGSTSGNQDGIGTAAKFSYPRGICIDSNGNLFVVHSSSNIRKITPAGVVSTISTPSLNSFDSICIDGSGNLYVGGDAKIHKVTQAGVITFIAGSTSGYQDGNGVAAQFSDVVWGLVSDGNGNLLVLDVYRVRKINSSGDVSTFAGCGVPGSYNGQGVEAYFSGVYGICKGPSGDFYVTDAYNGLIRKITPSGKVVTYAGSNSGNSDGIRSVAAFSPSGMCTDSNNNIYVTDANSYKILKVTPTGYMTNFAGAYYPGSGNGNGNGTSNSVRFYLPEQICRDSNGNFYVTDRGNFRIRKIAPDGTVTTFAGSTQGDVNGTGTAARFSGDFFGICVDSNNNVYVADQGNYKIKKITPAGVVTTYAGTGFGILDGPIAVAQLRPRGLCFDAMGNLFFTERFGAVRKITPTGIVSTVAGSMTSFGYVDAVGTAARFENLEQITIDSNGNLYVVDTAEMNFLVRKITPAGVVSTLAGSTQGYEDGPLNTAKFSCSVGICLDNSGNILVADKCNNSIRKISSTLSMDENSILEINTKVYPNPACDLLNIEMDNLGFRTTITLFNLLGEEILSQELITAKTTLNVGNISKGIYLLSIKRDGSSSTTKKIVID